MFKHISLILILFASKIVPAQQNDDHDKHKIVVGLTQAPPMIYLYDNQPPEGMVVDFIRNVAKAENWDIVWRAGAWSEVYADAESGKVDLMTYIAYTPERSKTFTFSKETFITGWGQVYIKSGNDEIHSVLDFDDKTVAVVRNDIHSYGFIELCEKFKVNCNIDYVDNYDIAFGKLEKNQVDGAVCGSTVGVTYQKKYDIDRSPVMYNPTNALFAVSHKKDIYILDALDKYLAEWKGKPGSPYFEAKQKWMENDLGFRIPSWIKYLVGIVLVLLLISITIVQILRRQIKKHILQHVNHSRQLKQIIDLVPHMIYVVDHENNFALLNDFAARFFGVGGYVSEPGLKIDRENSHYSLIFEDDEELFEHGKEAIHKEIEVYDGLNQKVHFNISKVPFRTNEDFPAVLTVAVDVTEAREYHDKIRYMAHHDDLTGLPNREMLKNKVNNAFNRNLNEGKQNAVLFIDLDYFKNINDSLGHAAGDELLKIIAQRLTGLLREGDMVTRIGGDEFILFITNLPGDISESNGYLFEIAESVLQSIIKKVVINHHELYISASIGIVTFPHDANSYEEVMQRADIAMYQAKEQGRNCIVLFEQQMQKNIIRKQNLITELRKSLAVSDFYIEFQPQVKFSDEEFIGLEALIRWNNKDEAKYTTSEFIHAAEESGLIIPISYWVIEKVFLQLEQWSELYEKIPFITINISVLQLHDSSIVEYLSYLMDKYSVPSHLVELEVTESVLVDKVKETVKTLNDLKNLGIRLSIDDFGTGYSSLSYLHRLPFDKLKIDYSFVKDIVNDMDTRVIVRTIIGMSEDLGLEVIAEGIETEKQLQILLEMGCDKFQGFYFDKPRSAEYIEKKYLLNWKKVVPQN